MATLVEMLQWREQCEAEMLRWQEATAKLSERDRKALAAGHYQGFRDAIALLSLHHGLKLDTRGGR